MACIRIDDLPILEELGREELQGICGEGLFPSERLRQMAAATTLGITLAAAPFAVAGNQGQGGRAGGPGHSQGSVQTPRAAQPSQARQSNVQSRSHTEGVRGTWHNDSDRGGSNRSGHVASFCQEHGRKFSHGFFYVGRNQKHFTERWWDARFATYLYFDPYAQCPYYWCEAHGVFYPIEYIETVGPGARGPGPIVGGGPVGGGPVSGGPVSGGPVDHPVGGGVVGGSGAPGGAPVDRASGNGSPNGVPVGGAGGAPVRGAAAGGAVGGVPAGDGSATSPGDEAPVSGAGGAPAAAGGAAPGARGEAPAGGVPAKPVAGPSGVLVAKNGTPAAKRELQQVPAGTFDGAIPEDPK